MSKRRADPRDLEARIGYVFTDRALFKRALTHVSAPNSRGESYQRLEFLGDRVLGLVIAHLLMDAFPNEPEGSLSRRLADLVRGETCAEIAMAWDLGPHLRIGNGEAIAGVRSNLAVLADLAEAVIGAVYLDGGLDAAKQVIANAYGDRVTAKRKPRRDPKTELQEWAQARGKPAPIYRLVDRTGPDHAPRFVIEVHVDQMEATRGEGPSKRDAEQAAARAMLTGKDETTAQAHG